MLVGMKRMPTAEPPTTPTAACSRMELSQRVAPRFDAGSEDLVA